MDEYEGTNWVARILRGRLFLNDITSLTIPKTWHHAASLWTWWGYCKWVQIRLTSTVDFKNWNQTLTTSLSCTFVCFLIVCDPFFLRIYFLIFFEIWLLLLPSRFSQILLTSWSFWRIFHWLTDWSNINQSNINPFCSEVEPGRQQQQKPVIISNKQQPKKKQHQSIWVPSTTHNSPCNFCCLIPKDQRIEGGLSCSRYLGRSCSLGSWS